MAKKESEIILDEIIRLHPFLDKKVVKNWSDHELDKASRKLQEPRFFNYQVKRQIENMSKKKTNFLND